MAFDYEPGEVSFVDFSGLTVPWYDIQKDFLQTAQIFVGMLGNSSYTYALATNDQSLNSWLDCHVRFFNFIGGVTRRIVNDNLKSGVTRPCRYEPELNPSYRELANHYGVCVMPARGYKPKDKARVEKAVKDIQAAILAPPRNLTFTSILEINHAIKPLLRSFNARNFQRYQFSRIELFEEEEKTSLKALPTQNFEASHWKKARVNIDYHIEIDRQYYSVPFRFAREEVEVRYTSHVIEVFCSGQRIAAHARSYKQRRHTTVQARMPPKHQKQLEWTPERIMSWARSIGPSVFLCCETVTKER